MERLSDYDYTLPEELIAQSPLPDRAASRLLHLDRRTGAIRHLQFRDCLDLLVPGDLLVVNDTRVTARRLYGHRESGARIEILLLTDLGNQTWRCLAKPGRRLPIGTTVRIDESLHANVVDIEESGIRVIRFDGDPTRAGVVPLPPYIRGTIGDEDRYQTVYSATGGSSAAPTAGLHFTRELLQAVSRRGVEVAQVTLDVGLDTFRPVQSQVLEDHVMHGERCSIPEATAEAISRCDGRIIAVGTTTTRTLESLATGPRQVRAGEVTTSIFIRPGFQFQVIDGLFTNFHMPRTTMLMMLSALAGRENVLKAYEAALEERYRFLSFGDSMLIL